MWSFDNHLTYWLLLVGHWQRVYLLRSIMLPVSEPSQTRFRRRIGTYPNQILNKSELNTVPVQKEFQCQRICSNSRMRLSMKWRIMQIEENIIYRGRRPRSERPRGTFFVYIFSQGLLVWVSYLTVSSLYNFSTFSNIFGAYSTKRAQMGLLQNLGGLFWLSQF